MMRDLFPGYYRPTDSQFKRMWDEGIFVFDTNMLLNVYRYTPKSCETLLDYMVRLGDRLWIPYQVAFEFQSRRLAVIDKMRNQYRELDQELEKSLKALAEKLNAYKHHPYVDVEVIKKKLERLQKRLHSLLDTIAREHPNYGYDDPLRDRLDDILPGKIGRSYTDTQLQEKRREAETRCQKQIPPGYKDYKKNKQPSSSGSTDSASLENENGYGDVLIWFQILDEARIQKRPIILITDDMKEDWWYLRSGLNYGPRPELVHEMQEKAAVQFYIYPGDRFIEEATKYFNLPEQVDVVTEARAVREGEEVEEAIEPILTLFDADVTPSLSISNVASQLRTEELRQAIQQYGQHHAASIRDLLSNQQTVAAIAAMAKPSEEVLASMRAIANMPKFNDQLLASIRSIANMPTQNAALLASIQAALAPSTALTDLMRQVDIGSNVYSLLRSANAIRREGNDSVDEDLPETSEIDTLDDEDDEE